MAEVMPQETQGFSLGKPTLVCRWRISGGMLPLANRHMRALRSRVVDGSRVSTELVAWAGDDEDCWAIDPAFLLDPTTGRLWCSYGTYFGAIRIVELDPATGKRVEGNEAVDALG